MVNTAIALSLIVILLIGTELGYAFYLKREFQKSADLAALAGARALLPDQPNQAAICGNAQDAAIANAMQNLPAFPLTRADVLCGYWTPTAHFTAVLTGSETFNAVQVTINRNPALLLPNIPGNVLRQIWAQAVAAKDTPVAVFSVGSKLLSADNPTAPLMQILKLVGVDPTGTCIACYTGLANVQITPAGLLNQLGIPVAADITVGGLNALLAAQKISVGQLLDAVVTIAGQSGLVSVNASLIDALVSAGISLDSLKVQLGTDPTSSDSRGLFAQIQAPTGGSGLSAQINALDILNTVVGIGTSNHAVELKNSIDVLGIIVKIQTGIVEPPSIGIGGIGATAYNAQVRLYIDIGTDPSQLLGGLLGALGTSINLPISIDVVNALGTVTDVDCGSVPPQATINVDSPVLNACIGQIPEAALWSKTDACNTDLAASTTFIQLLGVPLLKGQVKLPALDYKQDITLAVGQTLTTDRNPLAIGDTVTALLNQLLTLLLGGSNGGSGSPANSVATPALAASLASYYIGKGGGNVATIESLLTQDGFTWSRPGGLLNLFSTTMPLAWQAQVNALPLLGGCTPAFSSPSSSCINSTLTAALQTANQDGIVSGVLNGLISLVTGLLGLNPDAPGTPLLSSILGPIVQALQPILNSVGSLVSDLLANVLGLDLGQVDVHLSSLSCQNAKLVY